LPLLPFRASGVHHVGDGVQPMREDSLTQWPQIDAAMERLAENVSAVDMRAMNLTVEVHHWNVTGVVRKCRQWKAL
jgi:glycine betaine/choline ABC-type transport system substrate-binding protein